MRLTGADREIAHPANIGLAFGDRDHAARLEQVEDMTGLDRLVIGRQRQLGLDTGFAFGRRILEPLEQGFGIGVLEIPGTGELKFQSSLLFTTQIESSISRVNV